ncbi:MAG TPA: helix-turn-helix domain-containing protein [Roseiflexaceae bacterium]|jgi:excisionase family DNA binding protein|nr:helix-turn-helix domain-containing protein [Roseiflexaceae bacterium]
MTNDQPNGDMAVLTVAEIAAYLKISPTTVWRHCVQGKLPAFRVGRQWRVERRDLDGWIESLKAQTVERGE